MEDEAKVSIYELFMLGLCVYVLVTLSLTTFISLDPEVKAILEYIDNAVCVLFLGDFTYKLLTAKSKRAYLKWGWIDLLSSIPMVDPFRWGRFARVFRIFRMLRAVRSARAISVHILRYRGEATIAVVGLMTVILMTVSSIAVLDFEREVNGNIQSAEDALWWSFATITTVGYGDRYPVSTGGRVVAAVLMVAGVGLFGTVSGLFASVFMHPGQESEEVSLSEIQRKLVELNAKLDALQSHLPRVRE